MIYLALFLEFFKIGLFCFGGAFGMIPLIRETVMQYGWLSESQFYDLIGVCESTPGPIAVNMATYIGSTQAGVLGSAIATAGVVTPSFLIILMIAAVLKNLTNNRYFQGFMQGVQPVIVALIMSTGLILLIKAVGYVSSTQFRWDAVSTVIVVLLCAAYTFWKKIFRRKMTAVQLILLSAVMGIAISLVRDMLV